MVVLAFREVLAASLAAPAVDHPENPILLQPLLLLDGRHHYPGDPDRPKVYLHPSCPSASMGSDDPHGNEAMPGPVTPHLATFRLSGADAFLL